MGNCVSRKQKGDPLSINHFPITSLPKATVLEVLKKMAPASLCNALRSTKSALLTLEKTKSFKFFVETRLELSLTSQNFELYILNRRLPACSLVFDLPIDMERARLVMEDFKLFKFRSLKLIPKESCWPLAEVLKISEILSSSFAKLVVDAAEISILEKWIHAIKPRLLQINGGLKNEIIWPKNTKSVMLQSLNLEALPFILERILPKMGEEIKQLQVMSSYKENNAIFRQLFSFIENLHEAETFPATTFLFTEMIDQNNNSLFNETNALWTKGEGFNVQGEFDVNIRFIPNRVTKFLVVIYHFPETFSFFISYSCIDSWSEFVAFYNKSFQNFEKGNVEELLDSSDILKKFFVETK